MGLARLVSPGYSACLHGYALTPRAAARLIANDLEGRMMPVDEFKRRADGLCREIRAAPRAEGSDRIYLPGEIEWERRRTALAEGIDLPDDVRSSLADLAREFQIEDPLTGGR